MAARAEPLALYLHWPFCRFKCPYCDFNVHIRETVDETRWVRAFAAAMARAAEELPGRSLGSVYFGGGTPSLMRPETVAAILDAAFDLWPADPPAEITLEANPGPVEAARFAGFRAAGINRLSLGVQALDDEALRFLGRDHDRAQAIRAIEAGHRAFERVSFDLIYARPGQDPETWRRELRAALALARDHLSLYQLTIERGTAFAAQVRRRAWAPAEEEAAAAQYEIAQEETAAAGLPAYEISNHAREGARSRHNLVYWRYGDFLGLGPGAHGRITEGGDGGRVATTARRKPEAWLEAVEAGGAGEEEREALSATERAEECLMLGLRLAEGVPEARLRAASGLGFDAALDPDALARLRNGGFVTFEDGVLAATPAGRQRLDAVLAALLAGSRP
ncbi:MAG: coproporphyrinogen III oxidase [Rhodospirillaceae bacterium]|jgi:putative oxygen-independent coproporphyrinogen III oxidase|nr:coproporphyrinogen III oxidase [Rhodospirillaceae bacterium]